MSTVHVTIERIDSLEPHPNADRLEIAKLLGTQTVVPKGEFVAGDWVVFFPPDICLPPNVSLTLGVQKYLKHALYQDEKVRCRVAATRLRGVPSYGFIIRTFDLLRDRDLGAAIDEMWAAWKYEPPLRPSIQGDMEADPPNFQRYTDIQHYYRNTHAFSPGLQVRVTEKIHGCVRSTTRLTMADGSKKKISQIQVGEYVIGILGGRIIPARVLQTFNNGLTNKWFRVVTDRKNAGRGGNSVGVIHCTPNHHFWCQGTYIPAEQLQVGDTVTLLRTDVKLTPVQHAVLLGKMIGDGYLQRLDSGAASVSVGHENMELLEWTARGLGGLLTQTTDAISGFGSVIHRAYTVASHAIAEAFDDFRTEKRDYGVKCIPAWVADALTPLALAFWYMDDGSLGHSNDGSEDKANFAVCRYNEADCEVLVRGLARFGIQDARYYQAAGYSRLRLNADDAERFFLLIAPYIPPALQYKLPSRYRGHAGWLPPTTLTYKPLLVPSHILAIEEYWAPKASRYDIETETHNYFANGILTHNSNCRFGLVKKGELHEYTGGSHRHARKEYDANGRRSVYWEPLNVPGVEALLKYLAGNAQPHINDVILFGELFGPGVQDMTYGIPQGKIGFRIFDIMVNGRYLDWAEIHTLCVNYGVQIVPLLYIGPFDPTLVQEWTNGPTLMVDADKNKSKFKGREGCVIAACKEDYDDILGRVIAKSVSADYLDRKGAQDNGDL